MTICAGCQKQFSQQVTNVEPNVAPESVYVFEGRLQEIVTALPGEESNNFSGLIYQVTDSMESSIKKGSQINVIITKKTMPKSVFHTITSIDRLIVGQYHWVEISTELPSGWNAIKSQFEWNALGLTAGLEIKSASQ